jgi:hypothetical protein
MSTGAGGPTPPRAAETRNVRTAEYHRLLESLPPYICKNADAAFEMFRRNPNHPALRRHQLDNIRRGRHRLSSWSVSVNLQYRAIYFVDGDTNVWYWIGSHSDYDSLTGRKA